MSLSVHVYLADANGKMRDVLDTPEGTSDLAGFESWRITVWGSETVRSLGARFFPQLADRDLYVPADQLAAFVEECALLRRDVTLIAGQNAAEEQVSFRLGNIEAAAARALDLGACVVIW